MEVYVGFNRGPFRRPVPVRSPSCVFAVGQRVFVACPSDGPARATLTDDGGKIALATVGDGTQVAILAWRPGVGSSTRYRVRATDDTSIEGWLAVGNLRGSERAVAPATGEPTPPPRAPGSAPHRAGEHEDSGRRFGQRSV